MLRVGVVALITVVIALALGAHVAAGAAVDDAVQSGQADASQTNATTAVLDDSGDGSVHEQVVASEVYESPLDDADSARTASVVGQSVPQLGPVMNGSVVSGTDEPLDGVTVEIRTPAGNTVWEIASKRGHWAVPVATGQYEVVASFDGQTVETMVRHENRTDVVQEVPVCGDSAEILVNPTQPAISDDVSFQFCNADAVTDGAGQNNVLFWEFGDGEEARSGASSDVATASHTYESAGQFEVRAFTYDRRGNEITLGTREVEVDEPSLWIHDVETEYTWQTVENVPFDNTFSAEVRGADDVESVEFRLNDGTNVFTENVTNGSHEATFSMGQLQDHATLTVVARDDAGNVDREYADVSVYGTPDWFNWYVKSNVSNGVTVSAENGQLRFTIARTLLDVQGASGSIDKVPGLSGTVDAEATVNASASVYVPSLRVVGELNGDGELRIASGAVLIDASGTANFDVTPQQNQFATFEGGTFEAEVVGDIAGPPPVEFDWNHVPVSAGYELIIGPFFTLQGQYDYVGGTNFDFNNVKLDAGGTLRPSAWAEAGSVSASAEGQGDLYSNFDLYWGPAVQWNYVAVDGQVRVGVSVSAAECGVDATLNLRVDLQSIDDQTNTNLYCELDLPSPSDLNPFAVAALQAESGPVSVIGESRHATVGQVTDGRLADDAPALATGDGTQTLLWRSVAEHEVVDGEYAYEIAAASGGPGNWTESTQLTSGNGSHYDPVAAGNDNRTLAAWSSIDTDTTRLESLAAAREHHETSLAFHDGSQWRQPETIADPDAYVYGHDVATLDDGWVVTWQRGPSLGGAQSTPDATDVRYAVVSSDGRVQSVTNVSNASTPAVDADGQTATLTYRDRDAGDLVQERLSLEADGQQHARTEVVRYDEQPSAVAVDGTALAWAGNATSTPTIEYATNGTVETLSVRDPYRSIAGLEFVDTDAGPVLVYTARNATSGAREVVYRLRHDGEWTRDRGLGSVDDQQFTLGGHSSAPTDDGFASAVAPVPQADDDSPNVYALEQQFAPDYNLTVGSVPENATPGDALSLPVEVENRGERTPDESVPLQVRADGALQHEYQIDPVAPGESTTVTVDATVGDGGTVTLGVDPDDELDQHVTDNANLTLRFARPEIQLRTVGETTTATDDGTVQVRVNVSNVGAATAGGLEVRVLSNDSTVGATTMSSLAPRQTDTVPLAVDASSVDANGTATLVASDTAGVVDASQPVRLLQPNLAVHGPARFVEGPGGVSATVSVSNQGVGATTVTVEAVATDDEADVGTATTTLNGTVGNDTTVDRVRVPLENASVGDEFRFVASPAITDADPSRNVHVETVGAITPATGTVELSVRDARTDAAIENATVWIDGQGTRSDENGTVVTNVAAGPANVTVEATNYSSANASLAVPVDGQASLVVRLAADGSPVRGYANDDGVVDVDGLLAAIDDFRGDAIGVETLLSVIDYFRSGQPVG